MNARFAAIETSIDGIGEAYNQVAEGCTEIERRLEGLENSLADVRSRQHETTSSVKQVKAIKQKVDSIEFDIKTLISGRLDEHDKAIKDLTRNAQSQGPKDVDGILESVLLRLQQLEKTPPTTSTLSTTALAQALLDRLKKDETIEEEELALGLRKILGIQTFRNFLRARPKFPELARPSDAESSRSPQRRPKFPGGMPKKAPYRLKKPEVYHIKSRKHQIQAEREARARKRKRSSSKSSLPAAAAADSDNGNDARSAGVRRSRVLSSRPETVEDPVIDERFGEGGQQRRRSGRASKPAQLAAGTVSWAQARVLKKQRLGRA
ncbi:uncharacterized protein MYCFIDRAFT_193276 [Pseudocercospora fijiensis CIRAD86]|uniref:Uncharacterized protein n=1 Tax=Pseudocercospora fijiensis (strain CIRAD86) TaxID=383855 RepID=N1QCI0_PSEFD|nr:uncharacterized protein MYCFIDRAFT_193276 [Pseudocercospora fijiensis CIRAD86]EME89332.1 hypothetical protein MYCFIDRAFT_193276 [Pseudocercospora fijiensis CIRAD86]